MSIINNNQIQQYADVLAQAFMTDPLFQYFFPDEGTRRQLAAYTFRFILQHARVKGFIIETAQQSQGVAIWLPSSKINRHLLDQLRFGAVDMLWRQGTAAIARQKAASEHMKRIHAHHVSVPHLYLSTIGVLASHRGRGLASKMILPMLEKADRDGMVCYLDTHSEANIELYQRFGFEIVQESIIPDSNVRHWAMRRSVQV